MIGWTATLVGGKQLAGLGRRWQSLVRELLESQNPPTQWTCRYMGSVRFPVKSVCQNYPYTPLLQSSVTHKPCSSSTLSTFSREIIHYAKTPSKTHSGKVISFPGVTSVYGNYVSRRPITEDRKTRALTVWTDLAQIKSSPMPALVLGISGLAPFISAPGYMILTHTYLPAMAFAQTVYGAIILSFLGGVRWGITLPEESLNKPDWRNLTYSVVPSLIAWVGLLCAEPVATLTVMTGLAGLAYFDIMMYGYPPWFKALRFLLSLFAVLSLWTTFVCGFLLDSKKPVD